MAGHCILQLWFLSSSFFFFFPRLFSAVADWMSTILPHMMWLSVNLECMSEMCCTQLAENTGRKSYAKNRHLHTIAQLCRDISSQLRHVSTIGKNLLNSNISSTCPYNMVNFGPLTAEIGWRVWGTPANFNGFWLQYCTDVTQQTSTKLCMMFGYLVGWYSIYTFWGLLPLSEFCQVQNSLCVQVLHSPIMAALLHGTPALGISQTLWRGTRNGIMEL